jgi:sporulation protein YlmC with PRC-barrel domain
MTIRLSQLLHRHVRGDSGWTHGSVHDVRADRSEGRAAVTALLVGKSALRERLFGAASAKEASIQGQGTEIPWEAVTSIEPQVIRIEEVS